MGQTSIVTGQYVTINQQAATVLQRAVAWLIDIILISFATVFLVGMVESISEVVYWSDFVEVAAILIIVVIMCYPLLMERFCNGQSVGKVLMRIRVICLDGSTPSGMAYLSRWLLLLVDMGFLGLGLAFIIFSKNSQRIGDMAAGTTVVQLSKDERPAMLRAFRFATKHYMPTYPEVTHLSMRQVSVIEHVLYMGNSARRDEHINTLAAKVERLLGIVSKEASNENFLVTLYNDFQYYTMTMV